MIAKNKEQFSLTSKSIELIGTKALDYKLFFIGITFVKKRKILPLSILNKGNHI